ncbi:MAG: zinc-ribbon domain containing protein [Burkholderiales bacterium]
MAQRRYTGRNPSAKQLREAERIAALHPLQQRTHATTLAADPSKLTHINTYGSLPEYYIDRPFTCRRCGRREIWLARDQKWYYEEARGHMDAKAVECHACRREKKATATSRKETKK